MREGERERSSIYKMYQKRKVFRVCEGETRSSDKKKKKNNQKIKQKHNSFMF